MKVLTSWLRSYLPDLKATDRDLAEALTLRGIAVEGVFDLTPQHGPDAGSLFEMDITTNRVDAMNHYGIAREAAVIYGLTLQPLNLQLPPEQPGAAFPVRVDEDAAKLCGRFTARVLRGVTIEPSSSVQGGEVARLFTLLGQKQISNAVDATNYVTQAIGQPTHAFDLDQIEGGIVVRRARADETLKTLDDVERTLDPEDLVIADERRALSLAGVMGGWDSMITPATKNVLVEAAWFDPATIRRSSKRHGLHTDASHRFERGADFEAAPAASALVSRILLASGGFVSGSLVDVQHAEARARTVGRPPVTLRMSEMHRILGPTEAGSGERPGGISGSEATTILLGLGCAIAAGDAGEAGPEHALHGAFATHDLMHGNVLKIEPAAPMLPAATQEVPIHPAMESAPEAAYADAGPDAGPDANRVVAEAAPEGTPASTRSAKPAGNSGPVESNPAREGKAADDTVEPHHPSRVHSGSMASAAFHQTTAGNEAYFQVTLPSWRLDLTREIDLIEEIARVYGYNRFPNTLPAFTGSVRELPQAPALRTLRRVLLGAGWSEAISSTFVSEADAKTFAAQPGTAVPMGNPLSEEAGLLRSSLVPGMLAMLGHNLHRGVEDAALFELGTVFTGAGATATDRVDERPSLAFGATGALQGLEVDFFTAKGLVEAIAGQFTSRLLYFDRFPAELGLMPAWLHPGRSARLVMDGATIGFFGQLHPDEASRRKLKATVVLGELRVDRLLLLGLRHPVPRELSRFQPVRRDFSFLLPASVAYGTVAEALGALGIPELRRWEPGEVRPTDKGEYSLLLRTLFQSGDRTLKDEELQGWAQRIEEAVGELGGRLRS